jgi:hypothetical protein
MMKKPLTLVALLCLYATGAAMAQNANTPGDLVSTGRNAWTLHTPDDGRTTLFLTPFINGAWDWSRQTEFRNNGDLRFSGRIGVGTEPTTIGTLRLAVAGKIGAYGIHVTNIGAAWPDYVFQPAYRLTPLSELETYVRAHHHLPDVPSAKQVAQDGLDLVRMDALLLQKVEELTLHMIALQKENAALQTQLKKLEAAVREK